MADKEYRVGQILYVIPVEKPLVVPVCILEKRISETLEGTITTYIVKSPKPDAVPVDLASVKGSVFTSVDEVRSVMFQNSRRAIEDMIARAQQASEKAFGQKLLPATTQQQEQEQDPLGSDPLGLNDQPIVQHRQSQPQHVPQPQLKPQEPQNGSVRPHVDEEGMVEIRQVDGSTKKVKLAVG